MERTTQTNGITLLPCPFCGGEAFVNDDPTGNGGQPHMSGNVGLGRLWSVECDECGADGGFRQEREIAIADWNTRTALDDGLSMGLDGTCPIPNGTLSCSQWDIDACEVGAVPMTEEAMAAHGWVRERTCRLVGTLYYDGEGVWIHELSCGHEPETLDKEPPSYCPECGARVEP